MFPTEVAMPEPVGWDDPGFEAYLNEVTAVWSEYYGYDFSPDPAPAVDLSGVMMVANAAATQTESLAAAELPGTLAERARARAHLDALMYEDMAAIADACGFADDPGFGFEAASAEIRVTLGLTRRAADRLLDRALCLRDRVPDVLAALRAGKIDDRRAGVIVDETAHLPTHLARHVVEEVLGAAGRLTTGQLRHRIRKLSIDLDPEDAARRFHHAHEDRAVVLHPTESGTADLELTDLSPDRAAAAFRNVDRIARALRGDGETRTLDQLRADVALDLLNGISTDGAADEGSVHLDVDLTTLAGLDDRSGELDGYGPVIADIARQIAERQRSGRWTYTVTEPGTGRVVATGTTRRRPTADQARTVHSIYPTCVFPGCRHPARGADLDHREPWSRGGATEVENLAPLCRHDHRLKHEHGWSVTRLPDGDHRWVSPLGTVRTTSGRSP